MAGAALAGALPVGPYQRVTADAPLGTLGLWAHWDGEHYVRLAAGGYLQPFDPRTSGDVAFFPLYALLMRSFSWLFGGPVSLGALSVWGELDSLAAFFFALYFVYRLAEDGWGTRAAQGAVLTLAFFPTSFFFNAVYTESLFLMLSAGSVWATRVRRDLLLACLLAGLATATRNVGIFLLLPLAYERLKGAKDYRWRGAYLALAPAGLISYMVYLWREFGDPLLFYEAQSKWDRSLSGPLATVGTASKLAWEGAKGLLDPRVYMSPSTEGPCVPSAAPPTPTACSCSSSRSYSSRPDCGCCSWT